MKRLFSLVMALAIAGAPLVLEACQIACASIPSGEPSAHQAHSHGHHHEAAASHAAHHHLFVALHHLLRGIPSCDHDGEATLPSIAAARNSDSLILVPAAPPIDEVVFARSEMLVQARQSALPERLEIRLASPLRV